MDFLALRSTILFHFIHLRIQFGIFFTIPVSFPGLRILSFEVIRITSDSCDLWIYQRASGAQRGKRSDGPGQPRKRASEEWNYKREDAV